MLYIFLINKIGSWARKHENHVNSKNAIKSRLLAYNQNLLVFLVLMRSTHTRTYREGEKKKNDKKENLNCGKGTVSFYFPGKL